MPSASLTSPPGLPASRARIVLAGFVVWALVVLGVGFQTYATYQLKG